MPRRRATRGDLLAAVARVVGIVQVALLVAVALGATVGAAVHGKSARLDLFPGWLLALDAALCLAGVAYVVAAYRRGDLDEHTYDLRDPARRG